MDRFEVPIRRPSLVASGPAAGQRGGWRARLVIVPVAQFDLRAAEALEYSWRVPALEHRALHVASDEQALWALGREWMRREPGLPLFTVEDDGGVGETIARVVRMELASGFDRVVVIVGRFALGRRVHRLLHDRTSESIAGAVGPIPGALVGLMTVAAT